MKIQLNAASRLQAADKKDSQKEVDESKKRMRDRLKEHSLNPSGGPRPKKKPSGSGR